jgi:translation initiation factor 4G
VNRFIAELYQKSLLTPTIMLRCILELLQDQSEECLECMCKIVTTIGRDLEEKNISLKETMDKVNELVAQRKTSTRIRFMMQDVVELRNSKWKPRREVAKPKTMEEIALEAKKEAAAIPPPSPSPQSMPNHRGGTPGRGGMDRDRRDDKMGRGTPRASKPLPAAPFDAKKLSGLSMSAEVQLGRPSYGQWQSGSGVPKNKNMFTVLDDDKSGDFDGPNNNYSKSKQPPRL